MREHVGIFLKNIRELLRKHRDPEVVADNNVQTIGRRPIVHTARFETAQA